MKDYQPDEEFQLKIENKIEENIENENKNENEDKNFPEQPDESENLKTKNELEEKIQKLEKFSDEISNELSDFNNGFQFQNDNEKIEKSLDELATGFELNLNEPPPEFAEELDYEQGMSLQGAAYVPKAPKGAPGRGQNFTERLHQSMRGRKQRAEKLREQEEEKKSHSHSYRSKILIFCFTLLMALGFAYLALLFFQRWADEKIKKPQASLTQEKLIFLTGLADAAENAPAIEQTQISIINSEDNSEDKKIEFEFEIEIENKSEEISEPEPQKIEEAEEISEPQEPDPESQEKESEPAAFYEFLNEANTAYNAKLYDKAIIYFHRAMQLNTTDIRTYIGLAQAYKAKEMFFDSKRILDEARLRFKNNLSLTVETQLKILEEE